MNYKPKGRKKSTAKGVRIQTSAGAKKGIEGGKFKIVGTTTKKSKKTGKDIKYIEVERIGKVDGKGKKSLISQKMYQEKFVRI